MHDNVLLQNSFDILAAKSNIWYNFLNALKKQVFNFKILKSLIFVFVF